MEVTGKMKQWIGSVTWISGACLNLIVWSYVHSTMRKGLAVAVFVLTIVGIGVWLWGSRDIRRARKLEQ